MNEEIPKEPKLQIGTYQHYKGNKYKVEGLACHSETLEWYVVYRPLYDHSNMPGLWVRPYSMFVEEVEIHGAKTPRFKLIDKD